MENEQIKNAFSKVKQDITNLYDEILSIKSELSDIKLLFKGLDNNLNSFNFTKTLSSTDNSTSLPQNQTNSKNTTQNTTVPQEIEGLKHQNLTTSTGNEGVSTDRQTDRHADRQTQKSTQNNKENIESNLHEASIILNSLDRLKKEIRLKFKHVTTQEMAVFSTIYQLEEQKQQPTTYQETALKLRLSESSIRDYVQRMITKGIPIKKQKINNRKILLSISSDLKRIATLHTIIQLRGL